MAEQRLSTTEWVVLGLLTEGPSHGFALARQLEAGTELGRVYTVRRPLVYRALDRLVGGGLAEPVATEKGDAGPQRVIHQTTGAGRRRIERWLTEPVDHIRDLRIEFLLKVTLLQRRCVPVGQLVSRQRELLRPTFAALETADDADPVELWRRHSAAAVAAYLDDLERRSRT